MNRRNFLKLCSAFGTAALAKGVKAEAKGNHSREFVGVLCDTTLCIGCRSCEVACSEANGNFIPDVINDKAFDNVRTTSEKQLTVVNRYETEKGEVFVKTQCMHCWQPACASACLVNAMYKTKEGPIIWHPEKCMGCRFCMVSCPFDIPKFEYDSWNPRIQKCTMCWSRLEKGKKPACVDACPVDALMFGLKRQIMEIARVRIYNHPRKYVHHIYGENEVGGCSWLYLAEVPFEQLGFKMNLGTTPYPEYTREFLYAVPVILLTWPALLLGLNFLSRGREERPALEEGSHE